MNLNPLRISYLLYVVPSQLENQVKNQDVQSKRTTYTCIFFSTFVISNRLSLFLLLTDWRAASYVQVGNGASRNLWCVTL